MRNFNVDVIYVEDDSTSPFFSAEASLCPTEAGEREKKRAGGDGRRKRETEIERLPPFPASSHRPSRIPSGSLAQWRREPRHVFSINEKVFHAHHLHHVVFLSNSLLKKYKIGIVLCYEQNHYISLSGTQRITMDNKIW